MEGEIASIKCKQTGHSRILEKKKLRRAAQGYLTLNILPTVQAHSFLFHYLKKKKKKSGSLSIRCPTMLQTVST